MNRNEYTVIQGQDYKEMTIRLLEHMQVASDIGDRRKKIGLKPNLAVAKRADSGATTHPEIVDGLLTYLHQNGFNNIAVMEGSWVGDNTSRAVRVSGIYDVCRKHDVPFVDTKTDTYTTMQAGNMKIKVCDCALNTDYMINMPVLKGHCQTTITCALKNNKGVMPDAEKRRFHTLGLDLPIASLNTVVPHNFILVDNICGDLDFEEGGNPVVMNRVLGFWDPVLCDSFAAVSMGYYPEDVEHIRLAAEMGVGTTDIRNAHMTDLTPGGYVVQSVGQTRRVRELAGYVCQDCACSACYGSLIYALDRLQDDGCLSGIEKESIAIGQGYRGKTGQIGIGDCTKGFEKSLPGCPPKAVDIAEFLKNRSENRL